MINTYMDNNTDYRMVKLIDGSTIMGSITVDKDFLRITNALELQTVQRHTIYEIMSKVGLNGSFMPIAF